MPMGEDPDSNPGKQAADLGAAFGRKAGRLVKAARPGLERLAARTRPGVEKAGRDAVQYAREHEDELKQAAMRLARARVTGPLGLVVDAVSRASGQANAAPAAFLCPHCDAPNPAAARFCNQCGAPVTK
jgi:zinc ribbon protein